MKRLKTALLISAALNIFLGGLLLGGKISPLPLGGETPVAAVFSAEKQAMYQAEMEQARQRFGAGREKYDSLHSDLMLQLAAENFDSEAFDLVAADMLAERTGPLSEFLKTVEKLAADMTVEERKAMAEDIRLRYAAYRARKKCAITAEQKP